MKVSSTLIGNTSAITTPLERIYNYANTMYQKKAFIFPYSVEGMDIMEFDEALNNMRDLIDEY